MIKPVSIIMYHYVRDLRKTRYPKINALTVDQFKGQIGYIKKYYNVISAYDLMNAIEFDSELPPKSLLLTFDDGFIDHFTNVFPVLDKEKISACFFPSGKCILENQVLDVHKIHFILASVQDEKKLVDYIYQSLDQSRSIYQLESNDYYWRKLGKSNRLDTAEDVFVKRMLQRELPKQLRKDITNKLFEKYVRSDEKAFSKELYMSLDQVSYLLQNNMYIGSHGFDHHWLDSLHKKEQEQEIDLSLEFLQGVGSDSKRWIMCYPYGKFNKSLLAILQNRNCIVGLTTKVGIADLKNDCLLTLPRLDTNDLPKDSKATPNKWTIKAM